MNKKLYLLNKNIYLLLFLAITNASTRFTTHGITSLYRILTPFFVVFLLVKYKDKFKKSILFSLILIIYTIVISFYFYNIFLYKYIIFYLYIYMCYILIKIYKLKNLNFEEKFWKFLNFITTLSIIMCIIQLFIRVPYPNVRLLGKPNVNIFMHNENEISVALGLMCIIYFYRLNFKKEKKAMLKIFLIMLIIYINEAKITIIGVFLSIILIIFLKKILIITRKVSPRMVLFFIILLFLVILFILYFSNPVIHFRDYSISINKLIFEPIIRILTLNPFSEKVGSIKNRTNAIIYGLQELLKTKMFGIGFGNTTIMLEREEYRLYNTKSIHNLFFQILCEFGILAIIVYSKIIYWCINASKYIYRDNNILLKIIFYFSFFIMSSQSSEGILSNYYVWIILFYIILIPLKKGDFNDG